MDINTADKLDSKSWRLVRIAAFLFFAVAGVLLLSSLTDSGTTRLSLEDTTGISASGGPSQPT